MWKEENNCLVAEFKFSNFAQAFSWMTELALYCDKVDHHPEWTNVYNRVQVKLSTHSAGNTVTEKDKKLAVHMDKCYQKYSTSTHGR